jgi:hypothetical protein
MAASDLVILASLIDHARCSALVRQQRWPEGLRYPECSAVAGYNLQASQGRLACRRWTGFQAIIVSASVMAGPRGFGGASRPTVGRR